VTKTCGLSDVTDQNFAGIARSSRGITNAANTIFSEDSGRAVLKTAAGSLAQRSPKNALRLAFGVTSSVSRLVT
jgi:hypothetical protein